MPTVEPLSIAALPAVGSSCWRSARLPWRWAGRLGQPVTLGLAGAGVARLRWQGFAQGATTSTSREELQLSDGQGRRGRVSIDRWLALNLVARTLGFPIPKTLRRLGLGERGILAGHLAALLTFAGGRIVVDLVGTPIAPAVSPTVGLALTVEAAGTSGPAQVDLPPEWLDEIGCTGVAAPSVEAVMRQLETTALIELAETRVALSALSDTAPGDALVFDGFLFDATTAPPEMAVRIRIGDYDAAGVVRADGGLVFLGPFGVAPKRQRPLARRAPTGVAVVKDSTTMAAENDDLKLEVLAAAPVEVVAELGRLSLRGDEVLGLERGSVLGFGHQAGRIDLVVGGRPWARGELVNVDGELGVRITEMVRGWAG
jgi:flagellar motor switch/type III secretory pathway protein FliN